jgi:hypothetical protein
VKKIVLFSVLFVCVIASCKKSNSSSSGSSTPGYHFTATIDGKAQPFNVNPWAISNTIRGITFVSIQGFTDSSVSLGQILALGWINSNVGTAYFTTGSYLDTATSYILPGDSYICGSQAGGFGLLAGPGVDVNNRNHLKITITSLDSTAVKGTFSGDFFFNADVTGEKKSITNGDFFVPWKK